MSYRDDLAAAQARADALQRRVDQLEREKEALARQEREPAVPVPPPPQTPPEPAPPRALVIREPRPDDPYAFVKLGGGGVATGGIVGLLGASAGAPGLLAVAAAIGGFGALILVVSVLALWTRRAPRQRSADVRRHDLRTIGVGGVGASLAAEVQLRADVHTRARYENAPAEEIERVVHEVLESELHAAMRGAPDRDRLEREVLDGVTPRLDALGFDLEWLAIDVTPRSGA